MRTVTLYPDTVIDSSEVNVGGNLVPCPEGPTGAAAVRYLHDTTQWSWGGAVGIGWYVRTSFADMILQANQRIWGIDVVAYASGGGLALESHIGDVTVALDHLLGVQGTDESSWDGTTHPYKSPTHHQDWNDDEWTEAQVNAVHFYVEQIAGINPSLAAFYQLFMRVYVVLQPTVRISYPTYGAHGVSAAPAISWLYGGDGEPQNRYRVKIFSAATAEAPGFDPENDVPEYDSGVIVSSASKHQVLPGYLDDYTYYYVVIKVYKTMDFNGALGLGLYASPWTPKSRFRTNKAPVVSNVTVTPAAAPITTTTRPTIGWDYDDEENTPQGTFRVKVFTDAQYGAGGFDPETSEPTWDSDDIEGDDVSYRIGVVLANDTFRAYVAAAQTGDALWSDWDYVEFEIDVDRPDPPAIVVTPNDADNYFEVELTPPVTVPTPDYFHVERSEDGGTTWETPRGMEEIENTGVVTMNDYEAQHFKEVDYRVHSVQETADGDIDGGFATAAETVDNRLVWLKDPEDETNNVTIPVEDEWVVPTLNVPRTIHRSFGRSKPQVVRGVGDDVSFTLVFVVIGDTQKGEIEAVLNSGHALLLVTPKNKWYVEAIAETPAAMLWDELHSEDPAWKFTVQFQEVERP